MYGEAVFAADFCTNDSNGFQWNMMVEAVPHCCSGSAAYCQDKWSSTGTCIHSSSTVTVLGSDGSHRALRLTDVKVGQKVLALDKSHKQVFAEVAGLPHSKSSEGFVKITMEPPEFNPGAPGGKAAVTGSLKAGAAPKHEIITTLHHTFPVCLSNEIVHAADVKAGTCLHTTTGRAQVVSAVHVPVKAGDVTYTIELKDAELVAVGGVFTHAKAAMGHALKNPSTVGKIGKNLNALPGHVQGLRASKVHKVHKHGHH
jgi:hypothetical protein